MAKKNLEQSKKKNPESSTEPIEERKVLLTQSPRSRESSHVQQSSLAKNGQKTYVLIVAFKSVKAPENFVEVPENTWLRVVYKNHKKNSQLAIKLATKSEHQGRRIFFPREVSDQQKSEADLMLASNEALQKTGKRLDIRFFTSQICSIRGYICSSYQKKKLMQNRLFRGYLIINPGSKDRRLCNSRSKTTWALAMATSM